ncbi:polysaccharide lyase 8 family protein [Streptomyces sp. NBC_00243]|uniref:polysaccharide lyase 8 family protein n=1 Tax=Streptomyces sp. NBC_00243 TaxID=2975688 RepID=UPI002DD8D6EF|nr:polysaccharide lyase 8 family protein [Streptomyces sp. NBC_00243]WRZ17242.1 polysaccharide lyase 8 family protein [Streptomyces sp. NBC_00243]
MPSSWSRRRFLQGSTATALALGAVSTASIPAAAAATSGDEFSTLRLKWRDLILGTAFDPASEPFRTQLATLGTTAAGHLAAMAPATGSLWPDLIWADPEPDTDAESYTYSSKISGSYSRLGTLAQAYAQPGTGLTGDPTLLNAVVTGLDHLNSQVYNENTVRYGNWWDWQIGAPQSLMDVCVIMYDALTDTQITNYCRAVDTFVPDSAVAEYTGTSTGANRVDLCRAMMVRGVVGRSPEKITLARNALSPVFPYVTTGDGFYADGSYIQHTSIPYIAGYGTVLNDGLGRLFALLRDSSWEVTDPNSTLFLDTVEKAVAPFLYNGVIMDNVAGRGISRGSSDDHTRAHGLLGSILLLGQGASPEQEARWRALVKGWLERDRHEPATSNLSLSITRLAPLRALLADTSVEAAPEPVEHRIFAGMDRVTHRRRGWAASLSMASKRIAHYEYGNGENARGFHTGAGWLSWWGDDFGETQYSDAFWPTVDPYRLPGITASRKPLADGEGGNWGNPKPDTAWVGGTTDGEYAAVGQHLKGLSSTLSARKSWFFLDDAVVCLGAGICAADGYAVETTIDNRALGASGLLALTVDGVLQPNDQGWTRQFTKAGWAHVEGHAGYVFPGGARVNAVREERTGAWRDINTGGSPDPLTRRYLTLWTDHGFTPANSGYAYVLMPGASAKATAHRAHDAGRLKILANTARRQGVQCPQLGLTAVNFWEPGSLGRLTAGAPAAVLVREHRDGTATMCVADPAREATSLEVIWHRPVREVLSRSPAVASVRTGHGLKVTFGDLTGTAGATHTVKVRLG